MLRNKLVYILLSAAVSVALLAYLLSRIKAEDIVETLARIYWPAFLTYALVALLGAWLRALRYKRLLRPLEIGWWNIFLVTFIRNSLIDLLPARLGGLSYIYVLNKRLGFSFETATSSFVLASVLDTLTLGPCLIGAVLAVGFGANIISTPALLAIASIFFAAVLLVLWKIVPLARWLLALLRHLMQRIKIEGRRPARLVVEKFELTIGQLVLVQKQNIMVPMFGISLLIRLAKYVSVFSLFFGLLRSHGFALAELSFGKFILGISGAELTSALPVKGLAGFGTWESAWALAFRLMGFDPRLAIVSGIGVHLLTNLFEYSLGLASILILAWPYLRKSRKNS